MKTRKNKRIRKATKYTIIIIALIMLIISSNSLTNRLQNPNENAITKEIYKYTNKFNYNYNVNLINNIYMKNSEVEDKSLAYVTDLIDNINLDLNYEYIGSKSSNLNYTYSIEGRMQVVYTKDGDEQLIWKKDEVLLNDKSESVTDSSLKINEHLILDLKDKNNLLNEFKQQLGMTIDAKYTISMKIKIDTDIEGKQVENEFIPVLNVDLAEKTTKIYGDNNIEKSEYFSKEYKESTEQSIIIISIDAILALTSIILLIYAFKAKTINKVKNEYKYELNKILKNCKDRIVEVKTKPTDEGQEVSLVKNFGEIIKISEELFKPIIYYGDSENDEAWFTVKSGKESFRYILKK